MSKVGEVLMALDQVDSALYALEKAYGGLTANDTGDPLARETNAIRQALLARRDALVKMSRPPRPNVNGEFATLAEKHAYLASVPLAKATAHLKEVRVNQPQVTLEQAQAQAKSVISAITHPSGDSQRFGQEMDGKIGYCGLRPTSWVWGRLAGLLRGLGASGDIGQEVEELMERWHEGHRYYHNCAHLTECLDALDEYAINVKFVPGLYMPAVDLALVELALFWHDAVYSIALGADNEGASVDEFAKSAKRIGLSDSVKSQVGKLILATRHRYPPENESEKLIIDIDLLRLSSPNFDAYDKQIRQEYAEYPDAAFNAGRIKVLERLLEKPIYHTDYFKSHLESDRLNILTRTLENGNREKAAHENLRNAIAFLGGARLSLRDRNPFEPLQVLRGKRVLEVLWHNAHGDVLEIRFEGGKNLRVMPLLGASWSKYQDRGDGGNGVPDKDDLYVSLNGEEI